ncbi:MAG: pilus assembly protein [bacterium]
MKTGTKIKLGLMVSIGLFIALTFMPSSIADDTVLFLQPVNSAPPPSVMILMDESGSMYDLPCAVPDCQQDCGLGALSQPNNQPFFLNMGYNPSYQYPVFDPCVNGQNSSGCGVLNPPPDFNNYTGVPGAFYPNHVYTETGCRSWTDLGSISYACNNYTNNPSNCINGLKNYGYYYSYNYYYNYPVAIYSGNLLNFYPPKYVVLRKAMADIITYNQQVLLPQGREVRIGLADFNSGTGGNILKDLQPPCSQLGNANPQDYDFKGKFYNSLYGSNSYSADMPTSTPLADALLDIGAYFANNNRYFCNLVNGCGTSTPNTCCPNCTCNMGFLNPPGPQGSSSDSWCGTYNKNPWQCEKMFIILETDGLANYDKYIENGPSYLRNFPPSNNNCLLPGNDCECTSYNHENSWNGPHYTDPCFADEIASFLHNNNIRTDAECPYNQGGPTLDVYTIGFYGSSVQGSGASNCSGTPLYQSSTNACRLPYDVLQNAASNGGGLFAPASNYKEIENAFLKALADIIAKTHSYGTPSLPSIRTASQANAYIASFIPSVDNFWQGHLRAYTGAVITTTSGPVFTLFDRNGVAFTGSTGTQTCSFSEYVPPPLWDASDCLMNPVGPYCGTTPTSPRYTHVYTITPLSNPGFGPVSNNGATILKIPGNYTIPLTTANLFTTSNSNLIPSYFDVTDTTTMKNIINYVLGAKDSKGHVLGDIDHSDPTVVGVDNADILTYLLGGDWLPGGEGYQQYLNRIYNQPQIVIVGGDDGMIHAFDAGSLTAATVQNGNYVPYSAQYSYGTGQELWAFIPYDILPKLQYMANPSLVNLTTTTSAQYWTVAGTFPTNNTTHVFYIDGSPMVRDVWLNGVDNGLGLAPPAAYWHTVLIIGERLGGVYYIALDITDRLHPKFMWEFTDQDMGFTFDQVFTHSPPIGPVWLGFDPQNTSTVTTTTSWVVFLNGGYDLSATTPISNWRGRGFYVVDIKTGKKLWEDHSMLYPTPASPSAVSRSLSGFSEAYLPDIGGNVWRYNFGTKTNPGAYDSSTGEVRTCISSSDTNCWSAQEIFAGPPSTSTAFPQAFYYIPSATFMPFPPYDVRISLGAGDRMNPLSCSPVNRYYSFITPQLYATQTTYGTAIPLTESNLTQLGGGTLASLNSNGWFVQLNTFTGTGQGTKNLAPSTYFNNIIYFTLFTPDPKACTTGTSTQFSCNAFGGTGVLVGLSYTGSIGTGQFYYASLGSGIPSAPVVTTQIKPGYYNMNILAGSSENTFTGIPGGQSGGFVARTLYMLYIPEYLHDLLVQQPWSTHALH